MKDKLLHYAKLKIRSEAVGGGEVPTDEMQCEFIISNTEKDSYGSFMTEQTLRNYAEDAGKGVPFVIEHEEGVRNQLGRTIHAEYDETKKETRAVVSLLRDTDDTPENMKINEYIRRIEKRFYDSVSVAFMDADETCNIRSCGKPIFEISGNNPCPHIPKRSYNGEECTYNVDNARLRHLALVSAPSNQNAKLLDVRYWSEDMRRVKNEGDGAKVDTSLKSLLERDGEKYRSTLIDAACKEGIRAKDDFNEGAWRKRFESMEAGHIQEQTNDWKEIGDSRWGTGGRSTSDSSGGTFTDTPIILPNYLFTY